jgi:hypothetical protein
LTDRLRSKEVRSLKLARAVEYFWSAATCRRFGFKDTNPSIEA